MTLRFNGQVALITGAGTGLGRSYARLLADMGAGIVVNDLGCLPDGSGNSPEAADAVVDEIRSAGGKAVANYDSVEAIDGAQSMVNTAVQEFGRIDILVNNAGNVRHGLIEAISTEDWDSVIRVHLTGSFNVTKTAIPLMKQSGYGRIVLTTSSFGLWGPNGLTPEGYARPPRAFPPLPDRGISNYAAAKMGMIGLMNALKEELLAHDIHINCIAPWSTSRLSTLPDDIKSNLRPELVAPMVAYLCSSACQTSGQIFVAGGGYYGRVALVEGKGTAFAPSSDVTVDDIVANIDRISDLSEWDDFTDPEGEGVTRILPNIGQRHTR